jgi:hypothetical protein
VKPIFEADTGLELCPSNYSGVWRSLQSEEEFERVVAWTRRQGTRHFLRDCLDLSVALDQNFVDSDSGQYTELGRLESLAKSQGDIAAIDRLVQHFVAAIRDLPFYRDARFLSAVPARPGKGFDLPAILAKKIASILNVEDITSRFSYNGSRTSIKSLAFDEKWNEWERAGLTLSPPLNSVPPVILIDDKYQSGTTLQFVASRLQNAGAGAIYGLCAVKTLRDTDNL